MVQINIDLRENHSIGPRTRERVVGAQACPSLARRGISLAGLSEAQAGFDFVRLKPEMTQILACCGGEGQVFVDGHWRGCGAGQAYITPPEVLHAYRSCKGKSWRVCWVMYPARAPTNPWGLGQRPALVRYDAHALSAAIECLYREAVSAGDAALLDQWAQLIHAYAQRSILPSGQNWLWKLWETVDADLAAPWSVGQLAQKAGISGEHLRRLCLQHLGRSPMRQVTLLRVRRAAALLASLPLSVENIALQVGYDNAFAFSTAFKRLMGNSPSQYRRQAAERRAEISPAEESWFVLKHGHSGPSYEKGDRRHGN